MKKLIYLSLIAVLLLTINLNSFGNLNQTDLKKGTEIEELYKHLAKGVGYPKKAQQANVQGNSIILFDVVDGKLKDLKISTELGYDCDTEVLNNILAFSNFKNIKPGKYALKTSFTLDGSKSAIINEKEENALVGYTELKLTITAMAPETAQKTGKVTFKTTEPLIILDGETISDGLSSIVPETIESIVILKDLSAISKYGDEGKNGVMIITTKKATDKKVLTQKPKQ